MFPSSELVALACLYGVLGLLCYIVPGRTYVGYATSASGEKLKYKCNSLRVHLIAITLYLLLAYLNLFDGAYIFDNYARFVVAAAVLGLIGSLYLYLASPFPNYTCAPKIAIVLSQRLSSKARPSLSHVAHDFFFGLDLSPRWGGDQFDIKLVLYCMGAVMLHFVILSAMWREYLNLGTISAPLALYALLMTWFTLEYEYYDYVHLYTYDFIDENVGFKLCWGCLCFYPFFYCIGVFPLVSSANAMTVVPYVSLLPCLLLYTFGAFLTRGANLQKYYFKLDPRKAFCGITPRSLGDGKLLVNGWWGASRHVNYLGEILQAMGIASIAGNSSVLPWLYPLYYVGLLVARERDDELRCARKYGKLWKEYCRAVPYRIVPYLY